MKLAAGCPAARVLYMLVTQLDIAFWIVDVERSGSFLQQREVLPFFMVPCALGNVLGYVPMLAQEIVKWLRSSVAERVIEAEVICKLATRNGTYVAPDRLVELSVNMYREIGGKTFTSLKSLTGLGFRVYPRANRPRGACSGWSAPPPSAPQQTQRRKPHASR